MINRVAKYFQKKYNFLNHNFFTEPLQRKFLWSTIIQATYFQSIVPVLYIVAFWVRDHAEKTVAS